MTFHLRNPEATSKLRGISRGYLRTPETFVVIGWLRQAGSRRNWQAQHRGVLEEGFLQAHWIQNLVATNQAMVVIKQFRNFCNITWI